MTTRRATLLRLATLSLAPLLPGRAFADTPALSALPRAALLLGNGAYRPRLRNPPNDVAALAALLQGAGFRVATLVDGSKAAMEAAIGEYCRRLEREQCVGLFFYAGHGLQLGWRNYLVPVDAALQTTDEVPAATVELGSVLEGLRRAANPMNIVIVDACRNNPFAAELRTSRGLSQMDAPARTLLAYSTSPGNGADDGEGDNGLYTSHLLREMGTPAAKIEDVFKRVRLSVRRASQGRQIPWESTSLEDDFYFAPPAGAAKPTAAEVDRRYAEELRVWQAAEAAPSIAGLEDYLRRYPSGHFAELAQVRLDTLLARGGEKRVVTVSSKDNPFSQGSVLHDGNFTVGDRYRYRITDLQTGIRKPDRPQRVTAVSPFELTYNEGQARTDLLGNGILRGDGTRFADVQIFPSEYAVGRKWRTRHKASFANGSSEEVTVDLAIVAREEVEVPAGRFRAFHVVGSGWGEFGSRRSIEYWAAPDRLRRAVRAERRRWDPAGRPQEAELVELVAYVEATPPRGA